MAYCTILTVQITYGDGSLLTHNKLAVDEQERS